MTAAPNVIGQVKWAAVALTLLFALPSAAQEPDRQAAEDRIREALTNNVLILMPDSVPDDVKLFVSSFEEWRLESDVPFMLRIVEVKFKPHAMEWKARPVVRYREPGKPAQTISGPVGKYKLQWQEDPQDGKALEYWVANIFVPPTSNKVDWRKFWPPREGASPEEMEGFYQGGAHSGPPQCSRCSTDGWSSFIWSKGIRGTIHVRHVITEAGYVAGIELHDSIGTRGDNIAIYHISQFRYYPFLEDGIPVRTVVEHWIEISPPSRVETYRGPP